MTTATAVPPDPLATDIPAELLTPAERLLRIAVALAPGQRATIENVSWEDYEGLMAAREAAGRHFRLTYDQGSLEIMPTSLAHELFKKILALLIEAWLSETGGSYLPGGNVTVKLRLKKRGFEPDECYYIQNRSRMAGRRELDPATDPPPDLVIEAEVSRTVTRRLAVFAGLGVPEVWRYDGARVTVLLLASNGEYEESATSRAVPTFPFAEVPRYVALAESSDDYAVVDRAFRAWVRSLPPATPPG
jgi:Uma2 family endonuclease